MENKTKIIPMSGEQREKVIKGLECCSQMAGEMCRNCPYANECEEGDSLLAGAAHLAADALSLLKTKEFEYERGKRDGVSEYLREREEDEEYDY